MTGLETQVFGVYGDLLRNVPLFPAAGNHDHGTLDGAPFRDVFALPGNEQWYSYDWGRIHFDDGADDFGGGLTSFAVHPVRPQRYRGLDARLRLADLRFGIPGVEYLARGMDGS